MTAIRRPPRPPGWSAAKGLCRFCAGEIYENNGVRKVLKTNRTWHSWPEHPCLHLWNICNDSGYARAQVFLRDRGICSYCGVDTKSKLPDGSSWDDVATELQSIRPSGSRYSIVSLGAWDVEHQIPLWLVDREAQDALRFWLMGNLKTACVSCHGEKTAREAGQRAKIKRIVASSGLIKKKQSAKDKRMALPRVPF